MNENEKKWKKSSDFEKLGCFRSFWTTFSQRMRRKWNGWNSDVTSLWPAVYCACAKLAGCRPRSSSHFVQLGVAKSDYCVGLEMGGSVNYDTTHGRSTVGARATSCYKPRFVCWVMMMMMMMMMMLLASLQRVVDVDDDHKTLYCTVL